MRILAITLLTLCFSISANAISDFPFSVTRDQKNQIQRIEIPSQASVADDENLLTQLRLQLASGAGLLGFNEAGLNKDEQKVFARAKASLLQSVSLADLNNPLLEQEFAKALPKLKEIKVYRLIAAPYRQNAFDQENTVKEVVNQVLSLAKKILQGPSFEIFEFLVNETLEDLESRREFHQNRLLFLLDQPNEFTEEERSTIRTSIFYSRLGVLDFISRKRAQNSWNTYGTTQHSSLMKKCNGFVSEGDEGFGSCFKVSDKQVRNALVKRSSFSKAHSVAYQFEKPYQVRNERISILLLKLALRFVPGPSFAKSGVRSWLESMYLNQRRVEGFLYESARQNSSELAPMVLMSSANPLIIPRQL